MDAKTSRSYTPDECVAWVTLRPHNDDPLQPTFIETTLRGKDADDIWRQVEEYEQKGYSVWGLEGAMNR